MITMSTTYTRKTFRRGRRFICSNNEAYDLINIKAFCKVTVWKVCFLYLNYEYNL